MELTNRIKNLIAYCESMEFKGVSSQLEKIKTEVELLIKNETK